MKKVMAGLLILTMCFGLMAGCSRQEELPKGEQPEKIEDNTGKKENENTEEIKPKKKIMKLLRTGEESTLNPQDSNASVNSALVNSLTGRLYQSVPSEDGSRVVKVPVYADGEPVQDPHDPLVWTIKLKKNAQWPDGEKITADDWLYSWKMLMSPERMMRNGALAAKGAYVEIENAYAYYNSISEGNGVTWDQVGLKKLDDYTIQVRIVKEATEAQMAQHFASRQTSLVRKDIYEKCISADGTTCDYGSAPGKVMFCGPFIIKDWKKGTECDMIKNETFPLADRVHIDEIISRVVPDEATRLELFEKGECDYVELGTNGVAKYGEDPRAHQVTGKMIHTLEVNQNNPEKPYLDDPIFRKAIFYGINRDAIAKLTNNVSAPYFISTEGQILDDGTTYRNYGPAKEIVPANGGYDPELARKYLDEAFQKYNLTAVELSVTYNEESDGRRAASEYIQEDFKKVFEGRVSIALHATSKATLLKLMRTSVKEPVASWDLCWSGWNLSSELEAPWRKPAHYVSTFETRYTPYKNKALDEMCLLAVTDEYRMDDEKLAKLTVEMEKSMYEDMTCVPVMQSVVYSMHSERMIPAMQRAISPVGWGHIWSDMK